MSVSIKYKGKEIEHPLARMLAFAFVTIFLVVLIAVFGFVVLPVTLGIVALVFILTIPLHFILKLCGRRGFYVREGNSHTWTASGAFDRH